MDIKSQERCSYKMLLTNERHSTTCACTLKENDFLDYAVDEKTWYIKRRQAGKEERKKGGREFSF